MGLKYLLIIFAFFIYIFPLSGITFAAKIPRCTDAKPATAPIIISAIPGNTTIKLIWTEGQDPITHYLLEYGLAKNQMIYGAQNIGHKGTTSYTVNELTNGKRYYFRVHAVNNCRLKASHTVSAIAGIGSSAYAGDALPRLSFYKPNSATSTSDLKNEPKGAQAPVTVKNTVVKCTNGCYSWHLLLFEIILLQVFFLLIPKYSFIKPIYVLGIPIASLLIFYLINKNCVSKGLICEYYYLLSIVTFILVTAFQRQRLMTKAMRKKIVEKKTVEKKIVKKRIRRKKK